MTDEQIKKLVLICCVASFVMGAAVTAAYFKVAHANFYEVHQANIGGFIFKSGRIYSLTEMMTDDGQKMGITR